MPAENNSPITKSDLCWVLIKLIGITLIYSAVYAIILGIGIWWEAGARGRLDGYGSYSEGIPFFETLSLTTLATLVIGIYLLTSGRFVFRILMSVPSEPKVFTPSQPSQTTPKPKTEPVNSMGLTEREQQAFDKWLEANPDMQNRNPSDQLALFRDAQEAGDA